VTRKTDARSENLRRVLRRALLTVAVLSSAPLANAQTEQVTYYHVDAVGSVRMTTDASGQVMARYDYLPFGGDWPDPPGGQDSRRFAAKEHDQVTGFDYFGARYYASQTGRFTTVDPMLDQQKALLDPQRWNRYAYALNNPFKVVDPDGREPVITTRQLDFELPKWGYAAFGLSTLGGTAVLGGPIAWRAAVGCFLSPSCQSSAIDILEGAAGGAPRITPSGLPFSSGDVIARDFATGAGTVSMMAEAVVAGKTLHLKDIAVYPKDAQILQVGTKGMLELLQKLKAEARQLGFTELRITGLRFSGAKPGKEVDLLFDLTEMK